MLARINPFICVVKVYQTCTTLSPQLGVKVTFLWSIGACYTEDLHFTVILKSGHILVPLEMVMMLECLVITQQPS